MKLGIARIAAFVASFVPAVALAGGAPPAWAVSAPEFDPRAAATLGVVVVGGVVLLFTRRRKKP